MFGYKKNYKKKFSKRASKLKKRVIIRYRRNYGMKIPRELSFKKFYL